MFEEKKKINTLCDFKNCNEEGIYPAPKSKENLNEYNFYCLTHIRDFNKSWNFFEGLNEKEFENEIRKSTTWDRPSWKFGTKRTNYNYRNVFNLFENEFNEQEKNSMPKEVLKSWKILELNPKSSLKDVKKKYKTLAKKWHPDSITTNKVDKDNAKEKFVLITNAYKKIVEFLSVIS
tara:strand:+ start:68 stop:598 length:531 start_codon:yes stop_codon:yes gene_type:complete